MLARALVIAAAQCSAGEYEMSLRPNFDRSSADATPARFKLQRWPARPAGPTTLISFHIAHDSSISLSADGQASALRSWLGGARSVANDRALATYGHRGPVHRRQACPVLT